MEVPFREKSNCNLYVKIEHLHSLTLLFPYFVKANN